ncbi:RNA helicase [Scandinavium sp. H11S7]|uniref:ESA_00282 family adhesion-associated protein n=1 Tax=Scandinavium hiltneri TaxID=2926519 RepID=UPI002165BA3B|nr:RNA helicase [Scandinavium hiltneri]MCS2155881.1 RNA helicase [Scandinavium hiltneri]
MSFSIIYFVIALLLLMVVIILVIPGLFKNDVVEEKTLPVQVRLLSKEEGEDHFSMLMSAITPVWYWRVNHEYIDFLHASIKWMSIAELNATAGLFEAQQRCSDLNSPVYKYYDNIKKRCLNREKVPYGDLDVLNLQQGLREFSSHAYPELVALVWPEFQRPEVDPRAV